MTNELRLTEVMLDTISGIPPEMRKEEHILLFLKCLTNLQKEDENEEFSSLFISGMELVKDFEKRNKKALIVDFDSKESISSIFETFEQSF